MADVGGSVVAKREHTLTAFSADDEISDADFVASQIQRAGVDVITRDSVETEALEAARYADIISLDVRIGLFTNRSITAARWLKKENPFRAIFFFTRVPEAVVKDWPVNFILVKGTPAARLLNRIPLMILVHDICLALVREIIGLFEATEQRPREQLRLGLLSRLRHFYYLLPPIERSARRSDLSVAHRYQEFRSNLSPFVEDPSYLFGAPHDGLSAVKHLLLDNVTTELHELQKIPGVRVRDTLKGEINSLTTFQPSLAATEPSSVDAVIAPDATADEIRADEDIEPAFFLNVWFPDQPLEQPWLIVAQAARMLVNLGEQRDEMSLGTTDPISEEAEAKLDTVEYVDVLVICNDADVVPLRNRIQVPPRKETTAQFEITPLREGEISLTVTLLIKNDPIHTTLFSFEARETEVEGEAVKR